MLQFFLTNHLADCAKISPSKIEPLQFLVESPKPPRPFDPFSSCLWRQFVDLSPKRWVAIVPGPSSHPKVSSHLCWIAIKHNCGVEIRKKKELASRNANFCFYIIHNTYKITCDHLHFIHKSCNHKQKWQEKELKPKLQLVYLPTFCELSTSTALKRRWEGHVLGLQSTRQGEDLQPTSGWHLVDGLN